MVAAEISAGVTPPVIPMAKISATDQSHLACPTPLQKYFCFSEFFPCRLTQITPKSPAIPPHTEGRCATSRTRSGVRWTRMRRWTIGAEADGEVVWS
jgi:hypothetical protein